MTSKKPTKKELFARLLTLSEVASDEELVTFINHELDLLNKPRKTTKTPKQVENKALADEITIVLERAKGKPVTVKELKEMDGGLAELSSQKLSAVLRGMVEDGVVEKMMSDNKRTSYYKLVKD